MDFRQAQRAAHPDWFNAPVPCFGDSASSELLVLGLAPGLKGANRTGRVFTGDGAGVMLYHTMLKFNFASGVYAAVACDGLKLQNAVISNVVRCVPPENVPTTAEVKNCQTYLKKRLASMPKLKLVLALGHVAHKSLLDALNLPKKDFVFKHGGVHQLDDFALLDSYHCSRRNVSTKILTPQKFDGIFRKARALLDR